MSTFSLTFLLIYTNFNVSTYIYIILKCLSMPKNVFFVNIENGNGKWQKWNKNGKNGGKMAVKM